MSSVEDALLSQTSRKEPAWYVKMLTVAAANRDFRTYNVQLPSCKVQEVPKFVYLLVITQVGVGQILNKFNSNRSYFISIILFTVFTKDFYGILR